MCWKCFKFSNWSILSRSLSLFTNQLWSRLCKTVFQAKPKGPDQGKSSLFYLTIPTHSATTRPKRVRFIGEKIPITIKQGKITCAGKDGLPWHFHPHNRWWQHCQWSAQDSWLRLGGRRTGHCANHIDPCKKTCLFRKKVNQVYIIVVGMLRKGNKSFPPNLIVIE